ncbi:hypothetical protein ABGB17_09025 [Sphaerisporangium sp. B11E5]|uniref:hypothetical protein n=1 Tax=Sphaerisporangium sp. B11E5 TaxID=3153563 RepID=UPI00325DDC4A
MWIAGILTAVLTTVLGTVAVDALHGGVAWMGEPETPFSVTTRLNSGDWSCGQNYVVPRTPGTMPLPDAPGEEIQPDAWWKGLGAVDGDESTVEILPQGDSAKAVVLHDLEVVVTARRPPVRVGAAYRGGECGGGMTPRRFTADLDRTPPHVVPVPGKDVDADGDEIDIPAVDFPYKISDTDPEIFVFQASTRACDCSWHLLLTWSHSGRQGTLKIDASGHDFRTTPTKPLPHWWWTNGQTTWRRTAP